MDKNSQTEQSKIVKLNSQKQSKLFCINIKFYLNKVIYKIINKFYFNTIFTITIYIKNINIKQS